MATPQVVLEGGSLPEDEWNEARLSSSLVYLQHLHTQVGFFKIVRDAWSDSNANL